MKNQIFKIVMIVLAIISFSCSTEDGKDGEQGPAGTANVMYSNWMNQNWNEVDIPTAKSMSVAEPRVNIEFFNNGGLVLGFFKSYESTINTLPFQENIYKNERTIIVGTNSSSLRVVLFTLQSTDGTTLTNAEINGSTATYNPQYRYVLIPGGVNISGKSPTDYKKMSYKEICELFNIPE